MTDGRQGKIDEKSLSAGFFQKRPEKDKQNNIGGQNIGHDAEHAVAFVENAGAHRGKVSPAWAKSSGT